MRTRVICIIGVAGATLLALVGAQVALAEVPVARFNAADQTAAKAVVLKLTDFDSGAGWKGGLEKNAKPFAGTPCPGLYDPKQSDLVITGVAKSSFNAQGVHVSSGVQIYQTAAMAKLDWARSVTSAASLTCARKQVTADPPQGMRLVSMKRISFRRVGERVARVRMIFDFTPSAGEKPVRLLYDEVAFGRGRTGVSFTFVLAYAQRALADAAEARMARSLNSRIRV